METGGNGSATTAAERVPTLRADVRLDVGADGAGALVDPVLNRRIRLDAQGVALCRGIAAGDALAAIAERIGSTLESVRAFAGRLVALDLCATPRAALRVAERQALARVKAAPAAHLKVLAGARFACTMCGSCCGGHNVGPVSEEVLDGLGPHLEAFAQEIAEARYLTKDLFVSLPTERATPGIDVMCHASHGSCVFLDDDGKCRIHARLGGEAKPLPCRIFPWELVATPSGVRVAVQRECRDFLNATGPDKPLLSEATAELAALVTALAELPTARHIPVVRGRELAAWAEWEGLEAALMRAVEGAAPDPDAILRALVEPLGAPAAPAAGATFAAWRARVLGPLRQMLAAAPAPDERMLIRVDALRIAVAALGEAGGWVLQRALAPLDEAGIGLLRAHLRHALWATAPLRAASVEAGVGRLVAEWVLARLIAVTRAREVKRFHVTTQDLQDGLTLACFLFRHDDLKQVLGDLDALTASVFVDQLVAFLAHGAELDAPDARVELVKF